MISPLEKTTIKRISTRTTELILREDGIMQYRIVNTTDYTLSDLIETNRAAGILGGGLAYPNLIFISGFLNVDDECRSYAASEESNRYTLADAFVIDSAALKLIGNFYVKVNKPVRPTRIFNDSVEAVKWLKTFL